MRFNPFNPQLPARPDFFVGREPEILQFEKFLSQTINGSPMNLSITGNRGMGKTSILIKFEQIAKENKCLVLRISNYEGNIADIIDFTEYITSNLKRELLSKHTIEKEMHKFKNWIGTLKPTIEWKDISLSIEKQHVIQEMLRQRLLKIWEESKEEYDAIAILIDEAEALEKVQGILTFLREVFQRVSTEANYILVLAGKLNFHERMSESFSPLNRFFPCQKLIPFTCEEMKEYVKKKLKTVSVSITEDSLNYICERSEGHPYVLVAMCFLLFDSLNEEENAINNELILRSKEKIDYKLAEDFFSPMYHPITPKAKEVLLKIAENAKTLEFNFGEVVNWTGYERNQVSPYIKELLRKGVLNKPERGKYTIFHKLFLEYLKHKK